MQEKREGVPRAHYLIPNFHDVLDHCRFVDSGFLDQISLGMAGEGGSGFRKD